MNRFTRALTARKGATATEYMVMLILVAMVVLGITKVFGGTVSQKYADAVDPLSNTLASESSAKSGSSAAGGAGAGEGRTGYGADGTGAADGSGGAGDGQPRKPGSAATASSPSGFGAAPSSSAAGRSGGGGKSGQSISDGGGGPDGGAIGPGGKKQKKASDDLGGINPLVLVFALMLLFGLFYVMSSGKSD